MTSVGITTGLLKSLRLNRCKNTLSFLHFGTVSVLAITSILHPNFPFLICYLFPFEIYDTFSVPFLTFWKGTSLILMFSGCFGWSFHITRVRSLVHKYFHWFGKKESFLFDHVSCSYPLICFFSSRAYALWISVFYLKSILQIWIKIKKMAREGVQLLKQY